VDYITKPISPPILLARVQTHVKLKQVSDYLKDNNQFLEAEVQRRTQEAVAAQKMAVQAEKALSKSEFLNRHLVEHLPHRIFIKDLNSVFVSCNENYARDLGITPEQIVGKDDFAFHPAGLAETYRAEDRTAMEAGQIKEFEQQYLLAGQERWIHLMKVPFRDEQGEIMGVLGTFEDITERKQAEHQLKSANLARAIATEMGLSQEKIEGIRMAGSIHDIGKISIPAEILSKPTRWKPWPHTDPIVLAWESMQHWKRSRRTGVPFTIRLLKMPV
jgi:PAS domain S-box-containing protein